MGKYMYDEEYEKYVKSLEPWQLFRHEMSMEGFYAPEYEDETFEKLLYTYYVEKFGSADKILDTADSNLSENVYARQIALTMPDGDSKTALLERIESLFNFDVDWADLPILVDGGKHNE